MLWMRKASRLTQKQEPHSDGANTINCAQSIPHWWGLVGNANAYGNQLQVLTRYLNLASEDAIQAHQTNSPGRPLPQ